MCHDSIKKKWIEEEKLIKQSKLENLENEHMSKTWTMYTMKVKEQLQEEVEKLNHLSKEIGTTAVTVNPEAEAAGLPKLMLI